MEHLDKLDQLFEMQRRLTERILGSNAYQTLQNDAPEWILKLSRALQQEIAELIDCVPWKWWAHYQTFDRDHAKVELIDIVHFVILLAQTLGMDAEELFRIYQQKNKMNFQRQDSGYLEKAKDLELNA
jgi:dimeric dUTPase (all-alpha-NTP-PPase superfamily)